MWLKKCDTQKNTSALPFFIMISVILTLHKWRLHKFAVKVLNPELTNTDLNELIFKLWCGNRQLRFSWHKFSEPLSSGLISGYVKRSL